MINEISQNALGSMTAQPKGAGKSTGGVREGSDVGRMVSSLPVAPQDGGAKAKGTEKPAPVAAGQALGDAVDQLNVFAQSVQRQLEFSVDEASGKTIIKVVDKESGEVIRSIPSEEVLAMQKRLGEASEAIFNGSASKIPLLFQGKA